MHKYCLTSLWFCEIDCKAHEPKKHLLNPSQIYTAADLMGYCNDSLMIY